MANERGRSASFNTSRTIRASGVRKATLWSGASASEKIRTELSRAIVVNDEPVQVTASIGAVLAGPDEGATALLARADAALYEAKQSGRDRVVVKGD